MSKPSQFKLVFLANSIAIFGIGIVGYVLFLSHSGASNAKGWGFAGSTATVTIALIMAIGSFFAFPAGSSVPKLQASIAISGLCAATWAFLLLSLVNVFTSLNIPHSSSLRSGGLVLTAAAILIFIADVTLVIAAKRSP